jgi:hypothetical protein
MSTSRVTAPVNIPTNSSTKDVSHMRQRITWHGRFV